MSERTWRKASKPQGSVHVLRNPFILLHRLPPQPHRIRVAYACHVVSLPRAAGDPPVVRTAGGRTTMTSLDGSCTHRAWFADTRSRGATRYCPPRSYQRRAHSDKQHPVTDCRQIRTLGAMEKISVAVRVRPLNAAEKVRGRGGKTLLEAPPGLQGRWRCSDPHGRTRCGPHSSWWHRCTDARGERTATTGSLRHASGQVGLSRSSH